MKYELPRLPSHDQLDDDNLWREVFGPYDADEMRQYAEQEVAPLLAEIERLENECGAWKARFPGYEYRQSDECVSLKFEYR